MGTVSSEPVVEDMAQYLAPTSFFDYKSEHIQSIIKDLKLEGLTEKETAVKLFYYVRDSIRYSIRPIGLEPEIYTASHISTQDATFCIPKSILLGTLARGVGIPSRLHLVDFANHRLAPELMKMWGSNIMAAHCYIELYIDGAWRKATPALDKKTCEKHGFIPVEFDGIHDGLLKPVDINGHPHAEYVKDHGTFNDMSIEFVKQVWDELYGYSEGKTQSMSKVDIDKVTFK